MGYEPLVLPLPCHHGGAGSLRHRRPPRRGATVTVFGLWRVSCVVRPGRGGAPNGLWTSSLDRVSEPRVRPGLANFEVGLGTLVFGECAFPPISNSGLNLNLNRDQIRRA